jgi:hypothetical protein
MLAFGLGAAALARAQAPSTELRAASLAELRLDGAPSHGIFDPSVARAADGTLYMSLSGVEAAGGDARLARLAVRTLLARSTDDGAHWQLAGTINADIGFTALRKGKPLAARWQSEVSALAHDPWDVPGARWKLAWHQYLRLDDERRFEHGWIAYREAATPEALSGATPVKLLGSFAYAAVDDDAASWTKPPIAGAPRLRSEQLAHALANCAVFTEPSLLARPEGLYLALVCHELKAFGLLGVASRVVLLRCSRPCGTPQAWHYVGTVLDMRDAKALGVQKMSASDLFEEGDAAFLTVSPVGKDPGNDAYKGCWVIPFRDIATGQLARDARGTPTVQQRISLERDSFNGACSHVPDGPQRRLLIGQLVLDASNPKLPTGTFHLYSSDR